MSLWSFELGIRYVFGLLTTQRQRFGYLEALSEMEKFLSFTILVWTGITEQVHHMAQCTHSFLSLYVFSKDLSNFPLLQFTVTFSTLYPQYWSGKHYYIQTSLGCFLLRCPLFQFQWALQNKWFISACIILAACMVLITEHWLLFPGYNFKIFYYQVCQQLKFLMVYSNSNITTTDQKEYSRVTK